MTSYKVARRSFLGASGAAAVLYPLLRNLEAQATGAPAPLRFLIIHHPLGTTLDRWRPTATSTTTSFTLPELSAPFEPLRQYMVLIDGLNIVCGNTGDKTHEGGLLAVMTGTPSLGKIGQQDHASSSASIDQVFLSRSPRLGGAGAPATDRTPRGSLQLAADIRSDRNEVSPRVLSYRPSLASGTDINARRQPMYPTTQPLTVYNDYFASIMTGTGGSGGGGAGGGAGNAAALLAQRRSVLDFMRSDLARMQTLVPADQRVKLDVYADSIRQLETTIVGTGMGGAGGSGTVTPSVCMKPAVPPLFTESGMTDPTAAGGATTRGVDQYVPGMPTAHPHQDLGRLQLSLIKTAFACDLARVATFMWSPGTNHVVFPGLLGGAQMQRNMMNVQSSSHHPPSHDNNTPSNNWIAQVDKWYNQQTAEAIQEFRNQTDVDGSNLLENTVIVYVTEVARAPDHDFRNVPWAVFGGANTRVNGGTYLKVTGGPLAPLSGGTTGNRPINDVWLALAPAFGINDLTTLGSQTAGIQNGVAGVPMSTGPLAGVLKPA